MCAQRLNNFNNVFAALQILGAQTGVLEMSRFVVRSRWCKRRVQGGRIRELLCPDPTARPGAHITGWNAKTNC